MDKSQSGLAAAPRVPLWASLSVPERFARKQRFEEHRRRFPLEQLLPYSGLTVAWADDGAAIVEAAETFGDLWEKLEKAGVDPAQYTYETVPASAELLEGELGVVLPDFGEPPTGSSEEEIGRYWSGCWDRRARFLWNQPHYTPELIEQYRGKALAWALDGLRILALGKRLVLFHQLLQLGMDPTHYGLDEIPENPYEMFV